MRRGSLSLFQPMSRWNGWRFWLGVSALALAGAWCYITFDQPVMSLMPADSSKWDNALWPHAFTLLGKAWLVIWLLFVWHLLANRRREVLTALLALIVMAVTVNPLKVAVRRPRPYAVAKAETGEPQKHRFADRLSFPSGDTATIVSVAASVAPAFSLPVKGLLLMVCAGVGLLRVTNMAHYPSDVLMGATIGLLAARLAARAVDRLDRSGHLRIPFERQLALIGVVAVPLVMGFSEGLKDFLIFLRTYGAVVFCVVLAAKAMAWLEKSPE